MTPGTRLGPYEVLSLLGAGGMGEVYKARDTRLDRIVALKILPKALASDPQFRDRFDREARAISQLDHPHICALYDVGQEDGTSYLVMQYLDGQTLADRLQKGPLPADKAIEYAIQIADALARAHRDGIVHRDLKPGNIMLTKSGAKLVDFGLAKRGIISARSVADVSAATVAANLTSQGTILGTFHYMAPEQIEGNEADVRSDIWAFGCVLYEMLTGTAPFDGRSPASLIANILNTEPRPLAVARQSLATSTVDHVVHRCLAKNPDARWQAIADVAHELRWAASAETSTEAAQRRPAWQQPLFYAAALLLMAVALTGAWIVLRPVRDAAVSPMQLSFGTPADLEVTAFGSYGTPHFAVSPDGTRIAFVASARGRQPSLWIRPLDSRVAQEVPRSDDASAPFWFPDGQSLGFFAEGRLWTTRLRGESPSLRATVIDSAGGASNGEVILIGRNAGSVLRVPAAGGPATEATVLSSDVGGHRWPQFLPDGRRYIYSAAGGTLMIASVDSTASRELASIERERCDDLANYAGTAHQADAIVRELMRNTSKVFSGRTRLAGRLVRTITVVNLFGFTVLQAE